MGVAGFAALQQFLGAAVRGQKLPARSSEVLLCLARQSSMRTDLVGLPSGLTCDGDLNSPYCAWVGSTWMTEMESRKENVEMQPYQTPSSESFR